MEPATLCVCDFEYENTPSPSWQLNVDIASFLSFKNAAEFDLISLTRSGIFTSGLS
jgi:hypothetical protein